MRLEYRPLSAKSGAKITASQHGSATLVGPVAHHRAVPPRRAARPRLRRAERVDMWSSVPSVRLEARATSALGGFTGQFVERSEAVRAR